MKTFKKWFSLSLSLDHSNVRVQGEDEVLLCLERSSGSERKVGVWDYDLLYKTPGFINTVTKDKRNKRFLL